MELVDIRDLFHHQEDYVGKKITVGGWVRSNRNSKNFGFIVVNDGTFFEPLQVVYADGLENFQELTKIKCWCCDHCQRYTGSDTGSKTAI